MYAGLVSLARWPGWTLDRLREHQRYLVAWLDELAREGDHERADLLVAQIAAASRVLREPQPGGLTLEGVVRRRASQGGDAMEVATDVVLACPTRLKRHWDRVLALAETELVGSLARMPLGARHRLAR
jgi:hypothetical protein